MSFPILSIAFYFTSLIILVSVYFVVGLLFLNQFKNTYKITPEKKNYLPLSHAFAFIFFGIGRIIFSLFDFTTDFDEANIILDVLYIWKIATTFQMIGYFIFFIIMEKRIMKGKDKYLLVVATFIFYLISMMMQDVTLATNILFIGVVIILYIPFAYLYIAIVSEGKIRKKGIYLFSGFIILFLTSLFLAHPFVLAMSNMSGLDKMQIHGIILLLKVPACLFLYLGYK